jgi:D-3-phosphoglycerate dehydrogenase / 2-oxoglutarate reductase
MKIVVTEPLHLAEEAKSTLAGLGPVAYGPFSDDALASQLPDCEVLVVRLGRYIGAPLLALAPNLRFIVTATTGLDHIDLGAAQSAGVRLISLRHCQQSITDVSATAEHTLGLMLALARGLAPAAAHVVEGGWDRNRFWGTQLRGKRLGILGYGRIGAMVARYAASMGMEVAAHDRDESKIVPPAAPLSFEDLLAWADVISIHVTADPENRHLIDRAALQLIKPGSFLINTARGSLLDEAAVADAVAAGCLAGLAVDVVDDEERGAVASSPLLACARSGHNVLITPHIGGATPEGLRQAEGAVIQLLAMELGHRT